jgi:tetratricopeptide (TPR) repeat protein
MTEKSIPLHIFGEDSFVESVKASAPSIYKIIPNERIKNYHFAVTLVSINFTTSQSCQSVVQHICKLGNPANRLLVYAEAPLRLKQKHLDFAFEVGAAEVFHGGQRRENLDEYLKSLSRNIYTKGTPENFDRAIGALIMNPDKSQLKSVVATLNQNLDRSPHALKSLVHTNSFLDNKLVVEEILIKLTSKERVKFWSNFMLGRRKIASGRFLEGIEDLEKLETNNSLNSERSYYIGEAYINLDLGKKAFQYFQRGELLTNGRDERFQIGQIKASLLENNMKEAETLLDVISNAEQVVKFLNRQGIKHSRDDRLTKSIECFEKAITLEKQNTLLKAKIYFNLGSSLNLVGRKLEAIDSLNKSKSIGKKYGFTTPTEKLKALEAPEK